MRSKLEKQRDPIGVARGKARSLAENDRPILAGPWLTEVGYELLYWIPFLRWMTDEWPDVSRRLFVLSRGGARCWYDGWTAGYADVFDTVSVQEFVRRKDESARASGKQKQYEPTEFDSELLEWASHRLGLENPQILHPAEMYRAYRGVAKQQAIARFRTIGSYGRLRPAHAARAARLPDRYIAVRFYFNYPFPADEKNVAAVNSILRSLTERAHVALLNTGMQLDEHVDFDAIDGSRVIHCDDLMTPQNNLALQTAIIQGAAAFVGTYGGLSYLAPFYGVPSLSFYSRPSWFNRCHLDLAYRVFEPAEMGSFVVLDVHDAALLDLLGAGLGDGG
jgi:hypothetical protein